MEIRLADLNDVDTLINLRMDLLLGANKLELDTDTSKLVLYTSKYLKESIVNKSHIEYVGIISKRIIACGGISFYNVLPTFSSPTGERAYIINMYTVPEYRGNGYASRIFELLLQEAHNRDVNFISLHSTDEGKSIYERHGFVELANELISLTENNKRYIKIRNDYQEHM